MSVEYPVEEKFHDALDMARKWSLAMASQSATRHDDLAEEDAADWRSVAETVKRIQRRRKKDERRRAGAAVDAGAVDAAVDDGGVAVGEVEGAGTGEDPIGA